MPADRRARARFRAALRLRRLDHYSRGTVQLILQHDLHQPHRVCRRLPRSASPRPRRRATCTTGCYRQPDYTSFCDINETVSCTQAYLSRYGSFLGRAGGAVRCPLVRARAVFMRCRAVQRTLRESAPGYVFALSPQSALRSCCTSAGPRIFVLKDVLRAVRDHLCRRDRDCSSFPVERRRFP